MGNAWLWYYTRSVNPGQLETDNERRAFAFYSRWQSLLRWTRHLYDAWCTARLQRADSRELSKLSDHLLWDIGMERVGTDTRLRRPYRSRQAPIFIAPSSLNKYPGTRCVAASARPAILVPASRRQAALVFETCRPSCSERARDNAPPPLPLTSAQQIGLEQGH